jgi:hypothetical protein
VGVSPLQQKWKKRVRVNLFVNLNVMFRQFKEKNKNLLRLKLKSALKIEQISVVL